MSVLRGWRGPPLALQICGLLVSGLVVAQLVTLLLTMALPPAPSPQYGLNDIAAALRGDPPRSGDTDLLRRLRKSPPDLSGVGWLQSDRSRRELADLLGADARDVALAFYTPLPFAGTLKTSPSGATLAYAGVRADIVPASLAMFDAGGPPGGGGMPGGGFPGGAAGAGIGGTPDAGTGNMGLDRRDGAGRARMRDIPVSRSRDGDARTPPWSRAGSPGAADANGAAASGGVRQGARAASDQDSPSLRSTGPDMGAGSTRSGQIGPPAPGGPVAPAARAGILPGAGVMRSWIEAPQAFPGLLPSSNPAAMPADAPPLVRRVPERAEPAPSAGVEPSIPTAARSHVEGGVPLKPAPPAIVAVRPDRTLPDYDAPEPEPLMTPQRSLFGLAPAPFVQGDFVAALRLPDGHWAVVQPRAEPFPNAWQRRLMLWFAIAFAIVGPLGWLFARRLVKPLSGFASAAEQLGRDPTAAVIPLRGPAEIGRAANAFNLMQSRLRAFVDDRTAMVGAISHDLRTPLTRMRFRIEEVDDDAIRAGMIDEVAEMEAMITSVLDYIRDASTPGVRERLDLRMLVDDVVDDALLVGNDVTVEHGGPAPVEIDVLGMRRVLDNLLENAVKYGERARVRLLTDADDAIAEIIDDGPGLPDEELEKVFEPFYRTEEARSSAKRGSGLGLAVCRSIARAHGGDVRLVRSSEGFLAQVRVPLAFGAEREAA